MPLLQRKVPIVLNQLHRTVIIFIFVLLIPFLAAYIPLDVGLRSCKTGYGQGIVNMFRHPHRIGFEILELHFDKITSRNACLVRLILVIEFSIDGQDVLFQFEASTAG